MPARLDGDVVHVRGFVTASGYVTRTIRLRTSFVPVERPNGASPQLDPAGRLYVARWTPRTLPIAVRVDYRLAQGDLSSSGAVEFLCPPPTLDLSYVEMNGDGAFTGTIDIPALDASLCRDASQATGREAPDTTTLPGFTITIGGTARDGWHGRKLAAPDHDDARLLESWSYDFVAAS